jgi:CheY-like chemotaxis protein
MPVMNGLDATREIRQLNKQVPIIAQTAFAFMEDRNNTMDAGCTDFLTKPTSRDRLLQSLQTYVPRLKKTL